jgi:hypothetical protein
VVVNCGINTSVDVTIIKETPMAIQNSMKFLWKILWALVVPNGLPLYMTLYYMYVGLILGMQPAKPLLGTERNSAFDSLLNYFAVCPQCLDSGGE